MTTDGIFSRETTIYVSTALKLNSEQTQNVTHKLLKLMGCQNYNPGFNFEFIDASDLVEANASVDSELNVLVRN
jgi:hypothetical protein